MLVTRKVKDTSLLSNLKTYQSTLQFIPWSLDMFIRVPFQLNKESCSHFGGFHSAYILILSQVKHVVVKCFAQRYKHRDNVPTLRGEKQYISLNPLAAKLFNLNFHPLEVVSR